MDKCQRIIHALAREHGLEVRRHRGHYKLFADSGELVAVVSTSHGAEKRVAQEVKRDIRQWRLRQ